MALFTDVFEDATKYGRKIPTTEYKQTGLYPIIDQGQSAIAGYTNETDGVFLDVPAIIFGDHTRVLKYVDAPCFLGADGVKLLKAKISNPNYRYLYYALYHADIPNTGYNRHFKWLKEVEIPIPSEYEQKRIVNVLDKVSATVALRKQQLTELDNLVKSRFVEMFSDEKYPIVKASDVCDFITKGTTPPTGEISEVYETGMIPYLKVYNLSFTGELQFDSTPQYIPAETHNKQLARSKVFPNDVLMNIVGPPLGKFSLVTSEFAEWNINQAIAIFRAKEKVLPRYLLAALMQPKVLRPFLEQAVGIRQLNLSLEQCRNLEFALPPLEAQKAFVEFANQVDKSKLAVKQSLEKLETLKKSLMQEYFG